VPISGLVPLSLAFGSGLHGRSDTKRTTMRKHWQTDWSNFELWEPIGLTTNSKTHGAVFNFPDYSHCLLVLLPNPFLLDSRRTLSFTDYWGLNRYHIISYDIVSCRMIWYDTIACPIILYCVVSYIALYYIIAYPIILYRIIPCHIIRTSGNAFFI